MSGSTKTSGVMFGGLRADVPVDPDLDPPPGACYNCWKKGHGRINCPRPQVSPLCFNCGRRGVTLNDCPRCSSRHREYLARVREQERKIENKRKRTKQTGSTSADGKLAKAVSNLRITGGGGDPVGMKTGDSESSREERGSPLTPPPQAKRTRANSNSRRYYFHLGRQTPEGEHTRYSSRETVIAEDGDISCCGENTGEINNEPTEKTEPKINATSRKSDGASASMPSSYESCIDDPNNNTRRGENKNDNERLEPSRDGAAEYTDATADGEDCSACTDSNWSVRSALSSCGQNYATGSLTTSNRAVDTEDKNEIRNFLRFLRKIANQPVITQELLVLEIISEREKLLGNRCDKPCGQTSAEIGDPLKEFTNLVDAIAHLPPETQNVVLYGIASERKYLMESKKAQ